MTSPNNSGAVYSAIMCLITGQQFRYSHNLPHTCIIMEVHRIPDLLATASFVLNDNWKSLVPPDGMIACFHI